MAATRDEAMRQFRAATASDGFKPHFVTRPDGKRDRIYNEVATPDGLDNVMLSDRFVQHVIEDHQPGRREQFANYVLPTLQRPGEVWRQMRNTNGRIVFNQVYLARFDNRSSVVVVREMPKLGALAWTFIPVAIRRLNSDAYRAGKRLYRMDSKSGNEE